jgi:hypothetical protein
MTPDTPDEPQSIWVKAGVDLDGTYRLVVEYNADTAETFDQPGATAYASEIFTAVAYAEYDAAVLTQMTTGWGLPPEEAVEVVRGLRGDRPPLNDTALGLLRLAPRIAARTSKPFLACSLSSHSMTWQWDPQDANQHAGYVVQCYPVATLDSAYRRYLVGVVGIDQGRAMHVVEDLANWRAH